MDDSHVTHDERVAMLAEVRAAFDGVTREGGTSWAGAYARDMYEAAPFDDHDRTWFDLATDSAWRIDPGLGGFSFLDPIGFRYYLAAAMYRLVVDADCGDIVFHLTLDGDGTSKADRWLLEKWSLLNDRQRRTVARFLALMHRLQPPWPPEVPAMGSDEDCDSTFYPYAHALRRYWGRFLGPGAER